MKFLLTALTIFISIYSCLTATDNSTYIQEFEKLIKDKSYREKCSLLKDSIETMVQNNPKILAAATLYYRLILSEQNNPNTGWALQKLGRAYWQIGDFDSAFVYYSNAANFFINKQAPLEIFDNYIYMGLLFVATKDYYKAEYYFQEAEKYLDAIQPWRIQKHRIAVNYWNLAHINTKLQRFNKATTYLNKAFKVLSEIDSLPGHYLNTAHCLTNYYMGNLQTCLNKYDSAIYYYRTAIYLSRLKSSKYILTNALAQIGVPFNALHQFDSTILYCTESLSLAEINSNYEYKPLALEQLAEAYYATKQYKNAYECYKRFKITNDSINNYDRLIAGFINQKAEKEKTEIESRKNEVELRQTYTYIVASIIVLFLLVIAYVIFNRYTITKKLNAQLAESNATKNKLFAIISHDLKGPLSAFSELSNILSHNRNSITEEKRTKIMDNMHTSSLNILGLLDNLLSWSRSQMKGYKLYPELINLHELVSEVSDSIADLAIAKQINILNVVDESTEITADRNALEVVIRNLISNAIKFSYQGGNIEIRSQCLNCQTEISVSDSGIGLDETVKTSLFKHSSNRSTMGTNMEKGTGLGLVICKDIIELHGGRIWAEPNDETGSTFKFTI